MDTPQPRKIDLVRILPGILVSLIALAILLTTIDLDKVGTALSALDWRYLGPVVLLYLLALMARAKAWQTLLLGEVPYRRVFLTLNAGYFLNNVLPLRLGELGRAFLLGRSGLGFWRVLSTILIERIFDLALTAGLLMSTLPFAIGVSGARQAAIVVAAGVLAGLVALYLLARNREKALALFERAAARLPRLGDKWKARWGSFLDGLAVLTDLGRFFQLLGWMAASWALAVTVQYLLMLAVIPGARLLWAAFGLGVVALGVALPSSPAYVGVLEAAWIGSLSAFGVPPATALAYALASHLLNIILTGILGIYALGREGETLGNLYTQIRNMRRK